MPLALLCDRAAQSQICLFIYIDQHRKSGTQPHQSGVKKLNETMLKTDINRLGLKFTRFQKNVNKQDID
jgi:hypothetical protein